MQVSVESIGDLERKITVQVPSEKIDNEVDSRLRSLASKVDLKGFRRGKVPIKVVKQRYGQSVYSEVVNEVVQSSFQEAVSKENLQPAGAPTIDPFDPKPGSELEFTATFEIYPDFEIQDISKNKISQPELEINDADIDKMIETLREQHADWATVKRKSKESDMITVDFEGFIDDEAFEGGKAEGIDVVIGKGNMIPGFEDQLIGLSAGDSKTVEVTFPDNYQAEKLAGKNARFETTAKEVKESQKPEVDNEFIKKFGIKDGSLDQFRKDIENNMFREANQAIRNRVKNQSMDILLDAYDVQAPNALVQQETDNLRQQAMTNTNQTDASNFPDEMFKEDAEKRVLLGLIVSKIIRENNIELDRDRVEVALDELAASYEQPEQLKQYYKSDRNHMATIEAMVIEEQVVDWIKSQVDVSPEKVGFDELMNPTETQES